MARGLGLKPFMYRGLAALSELGQLAALLELGQFAITYCTIHLAKGTESGLRVCRSLARGALPSQTGYAVPEAGRL